MVIRRYRDADADALISIWRAAGAAAHSFLPRDFLAQEAQDIRDIHLAKAETWVLEEAGRPVGHSALLGNEIGGLFLDPSLHRKGLGRAMVDHAVALKRPLRVEVFKQFSLALASWPPR